MSNSNGKKTMAVGESYSYPMNGGDGPYSYSRNSIYQREVVDASKSMITEAIFDNFDFENSPSNRLNTIRIADLGCSVGPNTFMSVQNILQAIDLKHKTIQQNPTSPESQIHHPQAQAQAQTLEFQVFFNDLTANDFNTLFITLPPSSPPYFVAGVPGSFHHRVFPEASLHVAYSSYALNWMSRVPEEVVERDSPTWNKGRVHYTHNAKIFEAYSAQFKRDMEDFFRARAQEVVEGGLLLLLLPGCQDGVLPCETSASLQHELFGSCLMDMAKMGMISEEKVDSFNLHLYHTSPMEFRELIEANGYFHIEKMESFNPFPILKELPNFHELATHFRAAIEGLITEHFGSEIVEELFERYAEKIAQNTYVFDAQNTKEFMIFACLKRKVGDEGNGDLHFNSKENQNC
ncbi:unnamed protein product [Camellia sinensis]